MAEPAPDIFISYRSDSNSFARAVDHELRRQGVSTSGGGDDRPDMGVSWVDAAADALDAADALVVIVGDSTSPWQYFEIGAAVGSRKRVIPVYLTESAVDSVPSFLMGVRGIEAHDRTPHEVAEEIVRSLGVAA